MLYGFSFFRKEGEAVQDKFYVELRLSVLLGNNDFFILPASVGQDIGHDVYARLQCRQADFQNDHVENGFDLSILYRWLLQV